MDTVDDVYEAHGVPYPCLREINCTVHWFKTWHVHQKSCFMNDLVAKAVPHKVDLILENLNGMTMDDKPPSLFECQLRLFGSWFNEWTIDERNFMLERLESADPAFVEQFRQNVAKTAGICCVRYLSHYQILEVNRKASESEIKTAFYKKSKLYHPDASIRKTEQDGMFVQVCGAYDVLRNKELRMKYDQFLDDKQQGLYSWSGKDENEDFKRWRSKSVRVFNQDKKHKGWQYGYEENRIYGPIQLLTVPLIVLIMSAIIFYLENKRKRIVVSSNRHALPYYVAHIERAQWINKRNEFHKNTVNENTTESSVELKPPVNITQGSSVLQTWKS